MSTDNPGRLPARVDMLDGELFHSYVRRLTAANDLTPRHLGVSHARPSLATVTRVADAGGLDPDRVDRSVIRPRTLARELTALRLRTRIWQCRRCSQHGDTAVFTGFAFVFSCTACGTLLGPEPLPGQADSRLPDNMLQLQRRLIAQLGRPTLDPGIRRRLQAFGPFARRLALRHYRDPGEGSVFLHQSAGRPLLGLPEWPALFADLFELCWDIAGSPNTVDLVTVALNGKADDPDLQRVKSAIIATTKSVTAGELDADSIPTDIRYAADEVRIPAAGLDPTAARLPCAQ